MDVADPKFNPIESKLPAYREVITEPDHRSRSKGVWVVVLALAAVLGASAYYGHRALNNQNIQISQLFTSQATLSSLGQRVDSAEDKVLGLTDGWEGMGRRMTKIEAKVQGSLAQSRKYAETLTQQLHQQLSAELDARASTLDARLDQMESEQSAQSAHLARVEDELKQEITSVREENGRDFSGVRRQVETNSSDLSALSQRLDPKRVDFELNRGQTQELIPGVSLQITGTNAAYQRYRGSLWLLQDRRRLWLQDQSVHQPVRFFHKETEEPYELIVTDVTNKFVVGYLLVPVRPGAGGTLAEQRTAIDTAGAE